MSHAIKAVIFDLGGVIIDIDYNRTAEAFKKFGANDFDKLYSQAKQDHLFDRLETGHLPVKEFLSELNRRLTATLTEEQLMNAWNAMLIGFIPARMAFIRELKKNIPVFLLSNTNEIHHNEFLKIAARDLGDHVFENSFTRIYYSCFTGLRKPNAAIYEKVLHENNLIAGHTLFVDDSIQHIEGALKVGLLAEHLLPGEKIEGKYAGLLI